jgi:hypothetical protein
MFEKYIQSYSVIPKLENLGMELVAFTLLKATTTDKTARFIGCMNNKRIIFASYGMGLNKNLLAVSVHSNFADYSAFMQKLKEQPELSDLESFIICLKTKDIMQHLSFASIL